MNIIKPSAHILHGYENEPLKKIELGGRVCYKSEAKITDTSSVDFVRTALDRTHESIVEHAVYILEVSQTIFEDAITKKSLTESMTGKTLLFGMTASNGRFIISGNARMFRDLLRTRFQPFFLKFLLEEISEEEVMLLTHNIEMDIHFDGWNDVKEPETLWIKRIYKEDLDTEEEILTHAYETVRFIVDRGVSHEIVRHREKMSPSQESTRYCCYGNEKFGGGLTVIKPSFYDGRSAKYKVWKEACQTAETLYLKLLSLKSTAQEARAVLPNSLKTEVVLTGNMYAWRHFFNLRTSVAAHPQMREVAIPLKEEFKKIELYKNILE